jgi:hypothetical protein
MEQLAACLFRGFSAGKSGIWCAEGGCKRRSSQSDSLAEAWRLTTDLPNATASVCIDELLARAEHSQVNLELSCLCCASIDSFSGSPQHCSPTRIEESFSLNFATHLNSPHSLLRFKSSRFCCTSNQRTRLVWDVEDCLFCNIELCH